MKIYKTNNLVMFKDIVGNRPLVPAHVKSLEKSVLENNLLHARPILVNDRLEVIDGQHRLEVARRNGLTIYYTIEDKADYTDVVRLNTGVRNWTYGDYLNLWIARGHKEYELLKAFCDAYSLPVSVGLMLLTKNAKSTDKVRYDFKIGEFKMHNLREAEKVGNAIRDLRSHTEAGVWRSRDFISAVIRLLKMPNFNLKQILNKFKNGKVIKRQGSSKDYIRSFEDIYNYRSWEGHKVRFEY